MPPNCSDYATGSVLWRGALAANLPTRGLTLDALLVAINGDRSLHHEYCYPASRPSGLATLIENFP